MKHPLINVLLIVFIGLGIANRLEAQDSVVKSPAIDSTLNLSKTGDYLQLSQKQLQRLPFRNFTSFGLIAPSAYQLKGNNTYYYGLTSSGDDNFIDGMQLRDASNFPTRIIESYQIYTRQAPIQMGFNTGGMTAVETITPEDFIVQLDMNTDQAYSLSGINGELFVNIPLTGNKKKATNATPTLLIAGKFATTNNTDPVWKKTKKINSVTLASLSENPVSINEDGYGLDLNAEFVTADDLVDQKAPDNSGKTGIYPYIKLTIPVAKNSILTLGNYSIIDEADVYNQGNSIFNSSRNAVRTRRSFDNFLNWNQQFDVSNDLTLAFNLQVQYSNYNEETADPIHGKNFFDYGYVGKFTAYKMPTFEIGSDTVDGHFYDNLWILNSWDHDTLVTFAPSNINPDMAAYTSNYYDFYADQPESHYENMYQIRLGGGLINGSQPQSVYGLYNNTGTVTSGYQEMNKEKIRLQMQLNADYKKHHFTIGGEYNRETRSHYSLDPNQLWGMMRSMANFHIQQLDKSNPEIISWDGHVDTILYFRKYDAASQSNFSKKLRQALGLPVDGLEYILIDSYDQENNTIEYYDKYGNRQTISTHGKLLSMDMFDAQDFMSEGLPTTSYAGYDYTGKKTNGNDPYSFFNDFSINASQPKYWAAFIQDQFEYRNLKIQVGLRVDVYDANQPVAKDMYSLFPTNNVTEALAQGDIYFEKPFNIGDDFVVYVDKVKSPTRITGYRNGSQWYNADGIAITDPTILDVGSGISPYLKNPEILRLNGDWNPQMTFQDNAKTINFLPQMSIDYTLINRINFYANYSSFTQNPQYYSDFRPEQYYFWNTYSGSSLKNNPGLKPMVAGKFFTGVKGRFWRNLVVDLSYLYTSIDNYMKLARFEGAFPSSYLTPVNDLNTITTEGLEARINLVNTTGSGVSAGLSITKLFTKEEYPNILPVSDLVLNANLSYRFDEQINYQGPTWANNNGFYGLSASIFYQFRHGIPYYKTSGGGLFYRGIAYTPDVNLFNLNIQKDFALGKKSLLNVYMTIENVFNFQNVFEVYSDTGLADDDGFLSDPGYQGFIDYQNNPDSYRLLYQLSLYDASHYDIPRIWRIGVVFRY